MKKKYRLPLKLDELHELNIKRSKATFKTLGEWSTSDWIMAITGELGELANILKKVRRGDFNLDKVKQEVSDELADIILYLDLLSEHLNIDLGIAIVNKFNQKSNNLGLGKKYKFK